MSASPVPQSPPLKRKREEAEDNLEINLALPEPLSKKELRKAKKRKEKAGIDNSTTANGDLSAGVEGVASGADFAADSETPAGITLTGSNSEERSAKRSPYGIWIGNLPWAVTRIDIRKFLTNQSGIQDSDITRVHMPAPTNRGGVNNDGPGKPKNKGFAYVDFTTSEVLAKALELSEELMLGRRVLIKNSQSFEGRPAVDPLKKVDSSGKPPSKRVFIGNLDFATEKEDLLKHFGKCGTVEDVHVATFEDSGKCKGYAWVTFKEIESAATAVRGYTQVPGGDGATGEKRRFVDRIDGRLIRREFAEDATVRYNKRYGKGAKRSEEEGGAASTEATEATNGSTNVVNGSTAHERRREQRRAGKSDGSSKKTQRYVPHDTAPRPSKATGAIPRLQTGTNKVRFD